MELAGGHPAAGIDSAAFLQPNLGETDHHPAKQAQGKSGLGVADPAVVFAEGDVQSVMQAALDDPIAAIEFEKVGRIQLFEGETADEINDYLFRRLEKTMPGKELRTSRLGVLMA